MKKQLFSLIMAFALVMGLSAGAWAQTANNGLTPANARLAVVGSVSKFTVTEAGQEATYAWDVFEIANNAEFDVDRGTAASVIGTKAKYLTDAGANYTPVATDNIVNIQWLSSQTDATLFAVEVTSTSTVAGIGNSTCTTKRRFFVSVFNYTVSIELCDASGTSIEVAPFNNTDEIFDCNSWSSKVLRNEIGAGPDLFQGAYLTNPENWANTHSGRTTGANGGIEKTTETYFKVSIVLSGNPSSFDLDQLKWRLRYELQNKTGLSLYEIRLHSAPTGATVGFAAEGNNPAVTGAVGDNYVLTIAASAYNANSGIFFNPIGGTNPNNSADYVFQVRTHNNLGADDMLYQLLINETQLALQVDGTYNDGVKVSDPGDDQVGILKPRTETRRINMSPATSTIGITD